MRKVYLAEIVFLTDSVDHNADTIGARRAAAKNGAGWLEVAALILGCGTNAV